MKSQKFLEPGALVVIDSAGDLLSGSRKSGLYPTLLRIQADLHDSISVLFLDGELPLDPLIDLPLELVERITVLRPMSPRMGLAPEIRSLLPDAVAKLRLSRFLLSPLPFLPYRIKYRRHLAATLEHFRLAPATSVIALTSTTNAGIVGFMIAKKQKVPLFIMEHKTKFRRGFMTGAVGQATQKALHLASAVVCVGEGLKIDIENWIAEKTALIPGAKRRLRGPENEPKKPTTKNPRALTIEVVPNPLPNSFFEKPGACGDWIEEFKSGRFLFAGWTNWREIKRPDLLLDAFTEVAGGDSNCCLIIAGPIPSWLTNVVSDRGLTSRVLLTGQITREQIHELAYATDVCVMSSDFETFGLPAIEALAAGKIVISTASGGPEHLIIGPEFGTVVPRGDLQALAAAMRTAIRAPQEEHRDLRKSFAKNSFSEEAVKAKWFDILASHRTGFNSAEDGRRYKSGGE